MTENITRERLMEMLSYDERNGTFARLVFHGRSKPGGPAGRIDSSGYLQICLDGRRYLAHRLAWLYVRGEWPSSVLDHIDRDRTNNRIANLRLATCAQNQANAGARRNSKSGIRGVSWEPAKQRWHAQIGVGSRPNRKNIHLGFFDTIEEAKEAYDKAARERFGEFASAA